MCVPALIVTKGITFSYAELEGLVMWDRYAGLTLPNHLPVNIFIDENNTFQCNFITKLQDGI